ncbi:pyruvate dehydrogenase E2 component (dihydrolipoamide acetyltransferase) [Catalinimonas alkaloidigena]|uniref:Acetyltransferase component of pyruvate dehydrogenase complex n=1 Tax=Catalinimonas alkaloidigena TaxID=1075417 RepID=A0A1G9HXR5_9BACT|nr:pyruvate dehydrogenase complex dihydrolipoamide acetyltransferase [Catalinimonas alkaloidigena]SDL17751.1 pyruvate dehydrogenase E2 component (dihydrolipoamide acetyltransferase) [Catalinimonas alkaloidigena]
MAQIVKMPKMSDTMEEGVIAAWHKKIGDKVEAGDLMAEVETDKATMDYESYDEGTLLYIGAEEGESIPVDGVLAILGEEGEDISGLLKDVESGGAGNGAEPAESNAEAPKEEAPKAEKKAAKKKVDVSSIPAKIVRMPKMSDTMEEGVIAAWHKKIGDKVEAGDLMAEVETDKATMDYESYDEGTLLYIGAKEGESVAVNGVLAIVGDEGADYQALLDAEGSEGDEEVVEETEAEGDTQPKAATDATSASPEPAAQAATSVNGAENGRVKISPLARKMAEDKGFDIAKIEGSGEGGRIVKRDVENFKPSAAPAPAKAAEAAPQEKAAAAPAPVIPQAVGEERFEEVKISQMRKTIARRLSESLFTAPHFYLTMEINMDQAWEARKRINEFAAPGKISFNDMVIKAVGVALRRHPKVNSAWLDDKIRYNQHVHVGMAVAVDEGLLVPVIRFADTLSLSQISALAKDLGGKARSKKLQPNEMEGSTFTISNLGMYGIDEFTAIINPPNSCILAVGGIKETVIVENGEMRPGRVMKVTLSCDHRTVDGAVGSEFLLTLKNLLEDPVRILL